MLTSLINCGFFVVGWVSYYVFWIYINYWLYFLCTVALKIAAKLRSQVYNQDKKINPSSNLAILVTGSTSGIGLAVSKYFHARGYSVIAAYYSKQEPGYEELLKISQRGDKNSIFLVELNVKSEDSISQSFSEVRQLMYDNNLKLRALINNAGVAFYYRSQWQPRDTLRATVETNLLGPMLMTRQYMPLLIEAPGSRIVNVSSALSFMPVANASIYGSTKSGLAYYTGSLATDIAGYGVKAVTIYPGNLIKNTSIVAGCSDRMKSVFEKLSEQEKDLYRDEFEAHERQAKKVVDWLKRSQEKRAKSTNRVHRRPWLKLLKKTMVLLSGGIKNGVEIHESSVMESFDNAVSLVDPPEEMFAGNRFFNIVSSTFVESLSHVTRIRISSLRRKFHKEAYM